MEPIYLKDATVLPVGFPLIVEWHDQGYRSAAAAIVKTAPEAVTLVVRSPATGDREQKLCLEAAEEMGPRALKDRRTGREYQMRHPLGDKERLSIAEKLGEAVQLHIPLTPKEVAARLLQVVGETPRGSRKLAELAEIEYSEVVIAVLKRLKELGKIQLVRDEEGKGKWASV